MISGCGFAISDFQNSAFGNPNRAKGELGAAKSEISSVFVTQYFIVSIGI
jgi:hypothetical protein